MEIEVLGKSNAWPDAGGACSGYLVRDDDFTLLVDCGTGVFAKLRARQRFDAVDAILLSHLHPDHYLDLIPYSQALRFAPAVKHPRLPLFGPPGTAELLRGLAAVGAGEQLDAAFELHEYDPAAELALGPLSLRFAAVPHFIETYACRIAAADGSSFTYGADCRFNRELIDLARGSDLLLVEATLGAAAPPPAGGGHMTARQAGETGQLAGVHSLLVSHFSDTLDQAVLASAAAEGFGGAVTLASEGRILRLAN